MNSQRCWCLFVGLEILLDQSKGGSLRAPDHSGAALDDLPGAAHTVDLAELVLLAQLHVGVNLRK